MNCPNCGSFNNEGSKFCLKCGQNLSTVQDTNTINSSQQNPTVQNVSGLNNVSSTAQSQQSFVGSNSTTTMNSAPTQNYSTPQSQANTNVSFMGYFFIVLAVMLKPFTSLKEELNKFNGFKNSAIMSVIISGMATLVKLLTSMLSIVRVSDYSWSSGKTTTTWVWENLKELKYAEIIGKSFLIYLGIILVIAAVYYIASLIIKKQTNFSRLLGISALAVAPMLICSLVLSPLLSLIWAELAMPITIIGAVYTIVLLYEGMNSEIQAEGNAKYYLNLICFSLLGVSAYYLFMKLFMSSISGGLENIMDLFG